MNIFFYRTIICGITFCALFPAVTLGNDVFKDATAWWKMDQGNVGLINAEDLPDDSENDNDVEYIGGPKSDRPQWEKVEIGNGKAILFSGGKTQIRYNCSTMEKINEEVSFFVRFATAGKNGGCLFSLWDWKEKGGVAVNVNPSGNLQIEWLYSNAEGKRVHKTVASPDPVKKEEWYDAYVVLKKTKSGMQVIFRTKKTAEKEFKVNVVELNNTKGVAPISSSDSLNKSIGSRGWGEGFDGMIESLAIWNRPLNEKECK